MASSDLSPTMEALEQEPSSGASFFNTDYKKHGDLREMLDSSKDNLKLDAMKRIVSMMAKGRDVSDLFPQVVKNVASKKLRKVVDYVNLGYGCGTDGPVNFYGGCASEYGGNGHQGNPEPPHSSPSWLAALESTTKLALL